MSPRIRMSLQSNTQDANVSVVNVVNQVLEITGILLSSTILIKAAIASCCSTHNQKLGNFPLPNLITRLTAYE